MNLNLRLTKKTRRIYDRERLKRLEKEAISPNEAHRKSNLITIQEDAAIIAYGDLD